MTSDFLPLYTRHERRFDAFRYVYPVLSRRSGGLSVGINLNPDKICNFDCVYCQVNRRTPPELRDVDEAVLLDELRTVLTAITSGEIYETEKFRTVPSALRRLNDIAFSGDGEPTTYRNFAGLARQIADLRDEYDLRSVKLIVISNATMLHRPDVASTFDIFDGTQGEIWAKLDAGTESYYHQVERTKIPFDRILQNITSTARAVPLVIQTLLMRLDGVSPSEQEIRAYCDRLNEVREAGGRLRLIQIYTVARTPAEAYVSHIPRAELEQMAATVRSATGLTVESFAGPE